MVKKTSDIVIDTNKDKVFYCPICWLYVKSEDFDHTKHICKKCNKDTSNGKVSKS
jgi:transposase-like protein